MNHTDIQTEKQRLISEFPGADEHLLSAADGLLTECARMRVELDRYSEQEKQLGGTMRINPNNPAQMEPYPWVVHRDRTRAAYLNGMDKLMKWLAVATDDGDDGMGEYE